MDLLPQNVRVEVSGIIPDDDGEMGRIFHVIAVGGDEIGDACSFNLYLEIERGDMAVGHHTKAVVVDDWRSKNGLGLFLEMLKSVEDIDPTVFTREA